MIIFEGNDLFKGKVEKNGNITIETNKDTHISLLKHYNDEILIRKPTSLDNLFWAFLNDENSSSIDKILHSITKGKSFFGFLKDRLDSGSNGTFTDIDKICLKPKKIKIPTENEKLLKRYDEKWHFKAVNNGKKKDYINISNLSINSLLEVQVIQRFRIPIFDSDGDKITELRTLPTVGDLLQTLCYEFFIMNTNQNTNFEEDRDDFLSFEHLN